MFTAPRKLRARLLTPDRVETTIAKRGFRDVDAESCTLLETVGATFLDGYEAAAGAASVHDLEVALERVPTRFRGFAYEGAGMGAAIVDALPWHGNRFVTSLLAGRGSDHVYMIYVGVGWAMARLPRFLWPDARAYDPLLRPLVLDGYGFHQAYFHTTEWVHQQVRPSVRGWPGWDDGDRYAPRAIDQGIGRALWFVSGCDVTRVADLVGRYPADRHADLWGGVGLAVTYAGGRIAPEDLRALVARAGEHRGLLAQGSAFAAEARVRAGLLVPHVGAVTEVLCGRSPEEAAEVCRALRPTDTSDGPGDVMPAYERWRADITAELLLTPRGVLS